MFKQFGKRIFIALALLSTHYITSSWEMIEDLCITKPEQELTTLSNRLVRWGFTGLGGIGGFLGAKKIGTTTGYGNYVVPRINVPLVPVLASAGSALTTYILITEMCRRSIERAFMTRFISSWPEKRAITPWELHKPLEALYRKYQQKDPYFDEEALDTLRSLRLAVYNHFPQKYQDMTNHNINTVKFFNKNVNVTFDIGGILKGIAELLKVFYQPR